MPFADPRARLEHILEAIREIEGFASGRTLQDYLSQGWLRFATQRGIEIVSEASRRIPADLKAKHTEIPWADIAGIGNILRHGYDSLDHAVIWGVVENDLPPLKAAVEAMLQEHRRQRARRDLSRLGAARSRRRVPESPANPAGLGFVRLRRPGFVRAHRSRVPAGVGFVRTRRGSGSFGCDAARLPAPWSDRTARSARHRTCADHGALLSS